MSELISGKEAWIKATSGEDVQYNIGGIDWSDLTDRELNYWQGERFLNKELNYKFRLKPRTIKINGVEVPKSFNPELNEFCYLLHDSYECGYIDTIWKYEKGSRLAWRTEEEIKQVVAALRSVFNESS